MIENCTCIKTCTGVPEERLPCNYCPQRLGINLDEAVRLSEAK